MLLSAAVSALISSWVAIRWHEQTHESHDHDIAREEVFHAWLHKNLELTSEQETVLEPIEKEFAERTERLKEDRSAANRNLAHAIRDHDTDSSAINQSLAEINRVQNELREATIAHFFTMKEHLSPGQADRLREWTHDSITHEHLP